MLRWFLDGTWMTQLAVDNGISGPTGYFYLQEGIDVLASRAPNLESALLAAKMAGHERRHTYTALLDTRSLPAISATGTSSANPSAARNRTASRLALPPLGQDTTIRVPHLPLDRAPTRKITDDTPTKSRSTLTLQSL